MSCEGCSSETSGCCCASLTGLRGGIHPDTIRSTCVDLALDQALATQTRSFRNEIAVLQPGHIVSVDVSLICTARDEDVADSDNQIQERAGTTQSFQAMSATASASLWVAPGYQNGDLLRGGFNPKEATGQGRTYICTASVSSGNPSWHSHPDLFGYFFDGGLFVELNAPNTKFGVRVVINWIPRLQFVPAYIDPVKLMQHYWDCHREEEFLEGFYGGTELEIPFSESSFSSPVEPSQSSVATDPFSKLSDQTLITWDTL